LRQSMPSWEVHEKYAILMGIPIEIAREVNKLIDDPRWHDFFDSALERGPGNLSYCAIDCQLSNLAA
jgi:hypothetical protein